MPFGDVRARLEIAARDGRLQRSSKAAGRSRRNGDAGCVSEPGHNRWGAGERSPAAPSLDAPAPADFLPPAILTCPHGPTAWFTRPQAPSGALTGIPPTVG